MRLYVVLGLILLIGCDGGSKKKDRTIQGPDGDSAILHVSVVFGDSASAKSAEIKAIDRATARVSRNGQVIKDVSLQVTATRFFGRIEVGAADSLKLAVAFFGGEELRWYGEKSGVRALPGESTPVEIFADPLVLRLNVPVSVAGDSTYQIRWEPVPGAVRYELEESPIADFSTSRAHALTSLTYQSPGPHPKGTLYYRVRVQHELGTGPWSDVFGVRIQNQSPIASAGEDQIVPVGSTVTLDGSGSRDEDGDTLSFSWTGPLPLNVPGSATPSFTANDAGSFAFVLTVRDGEVSSAADTVVVRVIQPNRAPVAVAGPDQEVLVGTIVTLDGTASSDADGGNLTFQWSSPSSDVALSGSDSPVAQFEAAELGEFTFVLAVTDDSLSVGADDVVVRVVPPNQAPVASAGRDFSLPVSVVGRVDGSKSVDPEGESLSYSWAAGTAVTFSAPSAPVTAVNVTETGTFPIVLIVADPHGATSSDTVIVKAFQPNRPPVADAGPDQEVTVGAVVTLDASGSTDPDTEPLRFLWLGPPGIVLTQAESEVSHFEASSTGEFVFTVVVEDDSPATALDSVLVRVVAPNQVPVADAGGDLLLEVDRARTLDGSGSYDPEGGTLLYEWETSSIVQLSTPSEPIAQITADQVGEFVVVLKVTDPHGESSRDSVLVEVFQPNGRPTAEAGADLLVTVGMTVQLDGTNSFDPEGDTLSYLWSVPVEVELIDEGSGTAWFVAEEPGAFEVVLTVRDDSLTSEDEVIIRVAEPPRETTTLSVPMVGAMDFVWIEAGKFLMGAPDLEGVSPQHEVTISHGFFLGVHELTQEQWMAVMSSQPWTGKRRDDPLDPAVFISYVDALEFVGRLNDAEGDSLYRLPTSAEWEYACRAGADTRWSFGDDQRELGYYAWFNANTVAVGEPFPHRVRAKLPNPWGLHDMHGNVWEWVIDRLGPYTSEPKVDPVQVGGSPSIVVRGGAFDRDPGGTRSAFRELAGENTHAGNIGVRIVRLPAATDEHFNQPPVANAGNDQARNVGERTVLHGERSRDPDGDPLAFAWRQVAGPSVVLWTSDAVSAAFTPTETGTYQFELRVSDGQEEGSDTVHVAVTALPSVDAGEDATVAYGDLVRLNGSGSFDPNGGALNYRWRQVQGELGHLEDALESLAVFVAPRLGQYAFELSVIDDGRQSARDTVTISVIAMSQQSESLELPEGSQMSFVWIESGRFTMGSPDSELGRGTDEGPQREVAISDGFWLGQHEVTQEQWEVVMGSRPWGTATQAGFPVRSVGWSEASAFIHELNVAAGDSLYRLPTEAEWEYACRAGGATRWSFGDDERFLADFSWYSENAWDMGLHEPQAVGQKLPNRWGLFDMHGNVAEWVSDWYGPYEAGSQVDPLGPAGGDEHVYRSGTYSYDARLVRSAYRHHYPDGPADIGFRVVRLAEPLPLTGATGDAEVVGAIEDPTGSAEVVGEIKEDTGDAEIQGTIEEGDAVITGTVDD